MKYFKSNKSTKLRQSKCKICRSMDGKQNSSFNRPFSYYAQLQRICLSSKKQHKLSKKKFRFLFFQHFIEYLIMSSKVHIWQISANVEQSIMISDGTAWSLISHLLDTIILRSNRNVNWVIDLELIIYLQVSLPNSLVDSFSNFLFFQDALLFYPFFQCLLSKSQLWNVPSFNGWGQSYVYYCELFKNCFFYGQLLDLLGIHDCLFKKVMYIDSIDIGIFKRFWGYRGYKSKDFILQLIVLQKSVGIPLRKVFVQVNLFQKGLKVENYLNLFIQHLENFDRQRSRKIVERMLSFHQKNCYFHSCFCKTSEIHQSRNPNGTSS